MFDNLFDGHESDGNPSEVLVVILGGGAGSRLYPLTKMRAKPAVSFGGKYRLIDIPITNCLNSRMNQVFILTQFNSFSLNKHIWQAYSREVSRDGFIDVIAAEQTISSGEWFQGTADAVRQTLQYITYHKPRYVLILSGDQVYSMDFNWLLAFHKSKGSDLTISGHYTAESDIGGLGIMKVDDNMKILDFCEKPTKLSQVEDFRLKHEAHQVKSDLPFLASMGIYLFNTEVLVESLKESDADFGKGIIPKAMKRCATYAFPFSGYWEDVGTIKAFFDANMEWLNGSGIAVMFRGGHSIITHSRQLPPAHIRGARVENSLICEGSVINASSITNSLIGIRTGLGEGTVVDQSIIMGGSLMPDEGDLHIGRNCEIRRAIIDKDARIGDNCRIVNAAGLSDVQAENYVIRDGIVVIAQETVIPPGTVI